jgi:hypothetical protein
MIPIIVIIPVCGDDRDDGRALLGEAYARPITIRLLPESVYWIGSFPCRGRAIT